MKIKILVLSILFLSVLSACQSEYAPVGKHSETATFTEQISKMEDAGELPELERTDTIAGIDTDENGIRDDIDAYIQKNFKNIDQQNAVKQFAKSMQQFILIDPGNRQAAKEASIKNSMAISCIYLRFSADTAYKTVNEIDAITTNTKKRLLASNAVDKALDGTVISEQNGEVCDE
ncbi:hypothetical protein [Acinetobacter sp. WCHAc010052]|uniref:hypothetical protein n=1 Tax=Acinetobacter sp. WCHAc010052 TaxID=2004647 RepID=UPI000B3CBEFC|nr:hypothetical protein [Acinetobacter sp. WCHAc010052]AXY60070.1 hypothetical protein CDG61_08535 [Acinetobacter sp. WCHAc010052]